MALAGFLCGHEVFKVSQAVSNASGHDRAYAQRPVVFHRMADLKKTVTLFSYSDLATV